MDYDIAIIGAGPAGLSFAASLGDSGLKVAVIEKSPKKSYCKS
jgi:2-polyprenyl-6-methoxyphenol hydroxylase-like FAD-dependent oxidoreductase